MSKVGKLPVKIPKGIKVDIDETGISVAGPKGTLSQPLRSEINVRVEDDAVVVSRSSEQRFHRSLHGLTRALIQNMVTGVSEGFARELEMVGIGYRAEMKGKVLELNLGYSHPVVFRPPEGVAIEVLHRENKIVVTGIDKQLVGQTAAKIRSFRPPEPYKGKGIRYFGEVVRRKAGKAAGK
ncbi:MAG: 50S ribosomal protein L6 [Candidatus Zixiibacteriota bacterium]|nr:MAG: 50S ribosomal protein L6 [candidate division Zixibacteria bacterium]